MSRKFFWVAVVLAVIVVFSFAMTALAKGPGGGGKPTDPGGGGGHTETATNNLSFPAIAADGASPAVVTELLTVPYTGPYDGLTAEEIAALEASGPWYAQKTDGNEWAADFEVATGAVVVYGVDWGDNIESVSPTVGRPYRLETALFADRTAAPMSGYTMAMLAYPSSPNEVQGTNGGRYDSNYATITSPMPGLRIQRIQGLDATTLVWSDTLNYWTTQAGAVAGTTTTISFAPELNVGGKYIFGASTGGWKPTELGTYRLTFYIPAGSQIMMDADDPTDPADAFTTLGNLVEGAWVAGSAGEGGAVPIVVPEENMTYVDVEVVTKGGGGGNH
jgi:hypothetical protein